MNLRKEWMVGIVFATLFLAGGCTKSGTDGLSPPDPSPTKSLSLASYENCAELEAELKATLIGEMEQNADGLKKSCRYEGGNVISPPIMRPDSGGETTEAAAGSADATGTNLQEAGVDEADLLKTDGSYVYVIVENAVKIVHVWPFTDFGLSATIHPQGEPQGLYLSDGKLIILSIKRSMTPGAVGCYMPESMSAKCVGGPDEDLKTIEEVYDVTIPSEPKLIKQAIFTGELLDSRRIDARLYLVMSYNGMVYPRLDYELGIDYENLPACPESGESGPTDQMLSAIERLKNRNRDLINGLKLSDLMPSVGDGKEMACTEILRSESAVGSQLLIIGSDLFADASVKPATTRILSNGGTVYASKNALYVTATAMPYGWWNLLMMASYNFEDATIIHRFAVDGGAPSYTGSGKVEGHLLDRGFAGSRYSTRFSMAQFSMSEYDGYLRIAVTATTMSEGSGEIAVINQLTDDSRIVVLDTKSSSLEKVGELKGMGIDEKLYAVRFIGKQGYVVTFKRIDPLFVVDLSDPTSPKVSGELKVPGYSTYLHPLDEGYLVGLGFNVEEEGFTAWTDGLKLALFDVTNPSAPTEVGHREIGSYGSYSAAVEEHHAFTLDRKRGLIALPVDVYDEGSSLGFGPIAHSYSGVLLLKADLSGSFDTIGKIVFENYDQGTPDIWVRRSDDILRTSILGDGKDDGVVTLTRFGVQLNRIDGPMSLVGSIQ